jgi:excisionase family DNA binding protein
MSDHKEFVPMLTVSDVARLLSVHINTVRRWSNQGIIKAYYVGSRGDRRFRREDITRFLSRGSKVVEVRKGKSLQW